MTKKIIKDSESNSFFVLVLSLINLTCGVIHLFFNLFLSKEINKFTEFMIIENSLISFIFICFGYLLIRHKLLIQRLIINLQVGWWSIFCIAVIFNWGGTSTLLMFEPLLPFSESVGLITTGIISLVISIYCRQSISHHATIT